MNTYGKIIQSLCRIFSMKISSWNNLASLGENNLTFWRKIMNYFKQIMIFVQLKTLYVKLMIYQFQRKKYRIICRTVHFCGYDASYKCDCIMRNPVNLWSTSQCVSILNSITKSMTFWKLKWSQIWLLTF